MKHNILKYTERVFNMSDSLTVLNYQMKQNTFKYSSQNILETSEFLTKIRCKMELTFDTRKKGVVF